MWMEQLDILQPSTETNTDTPTLLFISPDEQDPDPDPHPHIHSHTHNLTYVSTKAVSNTTTTFSSVVHASLNTLSGRRRGNWDSSSPAAENTRRSFRPRAVPRRRLILEWSRTRATGPGDTGQGGATVQHARRRTTSWGQVDTLHNNEGTAPVQGYGAWRPPSPPYGAQATMYALMSMSDLRHGGMGATWASVALGWRRWRGGVQGGWQSGPTPPPTTSCRRSSISERTTPQGSASLGPVLTNANTTTHTVKP